MILNLEHSTLNEKKILSKNIKNKSLKFQQNFTILTTAQEQLGLTGQLIMTKKNLQKFKNLQKLLHLTQTHFWLSESVVHILEQKLVLICFWNQNQK